MASVIAAGLTSGTALAMAGDTSGSLQLQTNGTTTAVTIDTSQNVGIGTSSPSQKLEIYAAANSLQIESVVRNDNSSTGVAAIGFNVSSSAAPETTSTKAGIGLVRTHAYGVGSLCFYNNGTGSAGNFTTADERMRIDSSGNVGIGTASPTAKLNVSQDGGGGDASQIVRITDTNTANTFGPSSLTMGMMNHYAPNPKMSIAGTNGIAFCVGDGSDFTTQRKVEIDSSGNLMVNTATPQAMLTVLTTGGASISCAQTGTTGDQIYFRTSTTSLAGYISCPTSNTTSYVSISDHRLKENATPMTGALAKISALKPCTYTWKADGSAGQGFIAHELQAVVPDCVVGEKDATREEEYEVSPAVPAVVDAEGVETTPAVQAVKGTRTVPSYQGVDTSFLVATLTAAIQEAHALIIQLQADVAALKGVK